VTRTRREFIHEGKYAAEVAIELEYSDESWSPTMSADDAGSPRLYFFRWAKTISRRGKI
jgi:hypothetical protein